MIRNLIFSLIFVCLIIALVLSINGVERVELGKDFISFIRNCNADLNDFKIAIPNIPLIDSENVVPPDTDNDVISIFRGFFVGFFNFVNFLVKVLNVLISILNIIIQLIEFIIIVVRNSIILKNSLIENNTSTSSLAIII